MKTAISNIAWKTPENHKMYQILKDKGICGLEIAPGILVDSKTPYECPENTLKSKKIDLLDKYDLKVISMQSLLYGASDLYLFKSNESREKLVVYLKKAIKFAHAMGVKNLVFGSPKNRIKKDLSFEKAVEMAAPIFKELAEFATEQNTILSIEANPIDYGADFVVNNNEAVNLVEAVDHKGFMLNYDLSTVILNKENYQKFIERHLNIINHVHISSPFLNQVPGEHRNLYKDVIQLLSKNGYKKYISVEMRAISETNNLESVNLATDYLVKIVEENL